MGTVLFISGVGAGSPGDDKIPGGPIEDGDGSPLDYDIEAQTEACIENIRIILEACEAYLGNVIDDRLVEARRGETVVQVRAVEIVPANG